MTRRKSIPGVLLLCACAALQARAAILPTDLEARVGPNYQPVDADERAIWRGLARLEEAIRVSPQRLVAPELDAYARAVVERLIGRPAPELRIYFMRDASFNASMFPSGMMIVNTGVLIRVRDEAQFAAVLGHEVGHYFRRHSLDRYRDVRHKAEMADLAAAAAQGNGWTPGTESWNQIGREIVMSIFRYSRHQESEADAFGLMLMARAGYPPRAAASICQQLIDERKASAAAHGRRYFDGPASDLSTHPATERRIADLADTARHLAGKDQPPRSAAPDPWIAIIAPYRAMLLREQVDLNDPGASLYLLENLAKDGWTGLLRFNEGEVYRLRHARGDDLKAAVAYTAAIAFPDAPPEAWRAKGYALLESGGVEAVEAMARYLALSPEAPDAALVRALHGHLPANADEATPSGARMIVSRGSVWKTLPVSTRQSRWEEVWTRNGSQLDRLTLVDGLPDGRSILFQQDEADQQVPAFRADMTALDLASMLEVSYRVNGVAVFDFESIEPAAFLGGRGIKLRYRYASGVGIAKQGACVMRVVGKQLYAIKLEGVANGEFDAVARDFDRLVAGAQLGR